MPQLGVPNPLTLSVKRKPVQEESSGVPVHEFRLLSEIRREVYAAGADDGECSDGGEGNNQEQEMKMESDDKDKEKDKSLKTHRRGNSDGDLLYSIY